MSPPRLGFLIATLSLVASAAAQPLTDSTTRARAARETMLRATAFMRSLATDGGYAYKYSPANLTRRTAEKPVSVTQIAIQPPGTPSMGMAFLHAFEATKEPVYLEAARQAAESLARCQLGSGGWNRTADFDPARPNEDGRLYHTGPLKFGQVIQHTLYTTFDDDTTQAAVRFLVAMSAATKGSLDPRDLRIAATRDSALRGMLRAQYPNGAWPQRYRGEPRDPAQHPVKPARIPAQYLRTWPDADYTVFYPMNDNVQARCIETMLAAHRALGRKEYMDAAMRCSEFLLLAQLPAPQRGWAQQYDHNMEPAWARHMEPPGVCSAESGNVIFTLIEMYLETGDRKFLDSAGEAVAWLQRSQIAPNRWSRLYELGTNRPLYGHTDGKVHNEPPERSGYTWQSAYRIPDAIAFYTKVEREGRDAVRAARAKQVTPPSSSEKLVDEAITACDATGRWISRESYRKGDPLEDFITTKTFIARMKTLGDYVARSGVRGGS